MSERRTLIEGMKSTQPAQPADATKEQQFVYGTKPAVPTVPIERTALNTRIRADYAKTLKRVSLERQLAGIEPSTLQEVLEEALESWMRVNSPPVKAPQDR